MSQPAEPLVLFSAIVWQLMGDRRRRDAGGRGSNGQSLSPYDVAARDAHAGSSMTARTSPHSKTMLALKTRSIVEIAEKLAKRAGRSGLRQRQDFSVLDRVYFKSRKLGDPRRDAMRVLGPR